MSEKNKKVGDETGGTPQGDESQNTPCQECETLKEENAALLEEVADLTAKLKDAVLNKTDKKVTDIDEVEVIGTGKSKHMKEGKSYQVSKAVAKLLIDKGSANYKNHKKQPKS